MNTDWKEAKVGKSKLVVHCGGRLASKDDVLAAPVPEATESYNPVPWRTMLEETEKLLGLHNIKRTEEAYALYTPKGEKSPMRMFGLWRVQVPQFPTAGFDYVIGMRSSYDKSMANKWVAGLEIFTCDNLAMSGEINETRRNTKGALTDLASVIYSNFVPKMFEHFSKSKNRLETYEAIDLSKLEADHLILEMAANEVFPAQDIMKVRKEFYFPRHEEFKRQNAFGLSMAVTEIVKGDPWRITERTGAMHEILDKFAQKS